MKGISSALFLRVALIVGIVFSISAWTPLTHTAAAAESLYLAPNFGPPGSSFTATVSGITTMYTAVQISYSGISPVSPTINRAAGTASATLTAGSLPGPFQVQASVTGPGYPTIPLNATFTVIAPPSPTASPTIPPPPSATPTKTFQPTPTATQVVNQPQPNPPAATPTTMPAGVVLGRLTPDQGTVIDGYKEGVKLTFPAGAVNSPVNLNYNALANLPGGLPPAGDTRLYFSMEARNDQGQLVTQFNADYEICAQDSTGIMFYDGQKWVALPVYPGPNGGVCAKLNHFTLFAVVVGATPTPVSGGAPGAAGPVPASTAASTPSVPSTVLPKEASTAVAVPTNTPTVGAVPARLPSTGGDVPGLALFVLAAILFAAGVLLRRKIRV